MKKVTYYQAKARSIDSESNTIRCEGVLDDRPFEVKYDKVCYQQLPLALSLFVCVGIDQRSYVSLSLPPLHLPCA
jgi:NADH dehydrogenase FAD-containing subunit